MLLLLNMGCQRLLSQLVNVKQLLKTFVYDLTGTLALSEFDMALMSINSSLLPPLYDTETSYTVFTVYFECIHMYGLSGLDEVMNQCIQQRTDHRDDNWQILANIHLISHIRTC